MQISKTSYQHTHSNADKHRISTLGKAQNCRCRNSPSLPMYVKPWSFGRYQAQPDLCYSGTATSADLAGARIANVDRGDYVVGREFQLRRLQYSRS